MSFFEVDIESGLQRIRDVMMVIGEPLTKSQEHSMRNLLSNTVQECKDMLEGMDKSITRKHTEDAAAVHIKKRDMLISEAISRRLGRNDWTLEELAGGRCVLCEFPDGREIFSLDGSPLIEFRKAEVTVIDGMVNIDMKYRLLS